MARPVGRAAGGAVRAGGPPVLAPPADQAHVYMLEKGSSNYVGQTTRWVGFRFSEHFRELRALAGVDAAGAGRIRRECAAAVAAATTNASRRHRGNAQPIAAKGDSDVPVLLRRHSHPGPSRHGQDEDDPWDPLRAPRVAPGAAAK